VGLAEHALNWPTKRRRRRREERLQRVAWPLLYPSHRSVTQQPGDLHAGWRAGTRKRHISAGAALLLLVGGVACYALWNQAETGTDAPAFATELEAASADVETTAGVDRGLRTAVAIPVMAPAHQQELTPAGTPIVAQDARGPSSAFGSVLIKQVEPPRVHVDRVGNQPSRVVSYRSITRIVPSALFSRKICPAAVASNRRSARAAGSLPCARFFS